MIPALISVHSLHVYRSFTVNTNNSCLLFLLYVVETICKQFWSITSSYRSSDTSSLSMNKKRTNERTIERLGNTLEHEFNGATLILWVKEKRSINKNGWVRGINRKNNKHYLQCALLLIDYWYVWRSLKLNIIAACFSIALNIESCCTLKINMINFFMIYEFNSISQSWYQKKYFSIYQVSFLSKMISRF